MSGPFRPIIFGQFFSFFERTEQVINVLKPLAKAHLALLFGRQDLSYELTAELRRRGPRGQDRPASARRRGRALTGARITAATFSRRWR
jgi:hypothetical protein